MNPRCPECGLYELNDGSEDTLWTCKCELEEPTPATPTTCSMCLEPLLECDCAAIDEPTEPTSFERERDAAAKSHAPKPSAFVNNNSFNLSPNGVAKEKRASFTAGADFGYAKGRAESELESLKDVEWIGKWQNEANHLKFELAERRKEMDANFYKVEKIAAELSAYKKAKAENDERFQLEVGQLRALTEADKLEIDGLREENASYRARLEKAEQDYRTEQIINAEMTGYKAERDELRARLEESEAQHEQALNHYASEVEAADSARDERDRDKAALEYAKLKLVNCHSHIGEDVYMIATRADVESREALAEIERILKGKE